MFDARQINQDAFGYFDRLRRVELYVEKHYDENLTLAKLASVAGYERRYFSTFFHHKTGVRLMDWVTYVRVRKAIELMTTRNHSISRIAFSVGFNDLRTFERAFKRCTDQTPSALKKTLSPGEAAHAGRSADADKPLPSHAGFRGLPPAPRPPSAPSPGG